jgi:hypothetical protein
MREMAATVLRPPLREHPSRTLAVVVQVFIGRLANFPAMALIPLRGLAGLVAAVTEVNLLLHHQQRGQTILAAVVAVVVVYVVDQLKLRQQADQALLLLSGDFNNGSLCRIELKQYGLESALFR